MGTLITIEGGDGSGKATQTRLLAERLTAEGYKVKAISFPNYDSPSSALVKMYLAGDFGKDPQDVSPYVASTFYAVDRFASYKTDWKEFYESGGIILADRYTPSNIAYQMIKFDNPEEQDAFVKWLEDLEYNVFGLPRPDLTCLLRTTVESTEGLMSNRKYKTGGNTGDIHENNTEYLVKCHNVYDKLVNNQSKWEVIYCNDYDGNLRNVQSIHEELYNLLLKRNILSR